MVASSVAKKVLKKPPEKVRIGRKDYFWRNKFYEAIYWIASSPLPEIIFVAALAFSAQQPNSYFNYATQVWRPLLLLSVMASLAYFGYRIVFGRGSAAHVAALLFSWSFYSYYASGFSTTHSLLPKLASSTEKINLWQAAAVVIAMIALAGLVSLAARLLIARYTIFKNLQAYKILLLLISAVFVFELISFAERYFKLH